MDFNVIDFILRIILMTFFTLFLIQSISKYNEAKEKAEPQAQKYYFAYILFYLISLVNFLQAEIDLQYTIIYGRSMYPFPEWQTQLGSSEFLIPFQTLLFIGLFIPSLIPVIYIIEGEIFHLKYKVFTIIGLMTTLILVLIILIPPIINYTLIPGILMILALIISFYSIYFKLVFSSDGFIRRATLISLIGWILLFLAYIIFGIVLVLLGIEMETIISGIVSHIIAIFGVVMIFFGSRMLKR